MTAQGEEARLRAALDDADPLVRADAAFALWSASGDQAGVGYFQRAIHKGRRVSAARGMLKP